MDTPDGHAEGGRRRRRDLHATPRVFAREVAGKLNGEQGHVVGMLGPKPEEEWIADDLHAHLMDFFCRKFSLRPVRSRD